jgi:UMF1 family MFS transporter
VILRAPGQNLSDRRYRSTIHAWVMYDWGNSAFATIILTGIFPVYYCALANRAAVAPADATAYWG